MILSQHLFNRQKIILRARRSSKSKGRGEQSFCRNILSLCHPFRVSVDLLRLFTGINPCAILRRTFSPITGGRRIQFSIDESMPLVEKQKE